MTIKELNKIIEYKNLEKIHDALQHGGYRHASKGGVWEFDTVAIANAKAVENSEQFEDVFDDKIYVADLHTQVKEYPDVEFIVVTVKKVYRDKNNLEQAEQMELYTNASINEEYEREQAKICKCADCKREFSMRELCEVNGRLICDDCFDKDLKRLRTTGKSKLATKVKTKRK